MDAPRDGVAHSNSDPLHEGLLALDDLMERVQMAGHLKAPATVPGPRFVRPAGTVRLRTICWSSSFDKDARSMLQPKQTKWRNAVQSPCIPPGG
jgi:hypothetical protein